MPRYFFDVTNGEVTRDEVGTEFPDTGVAEREATRYLGELIADRRQIERLSCTVRNESGAALFSVKLNVAVTPSE